ncbi:MAG: transposase-like zinc-binding domain-containing protein [Bacteroidales bacterium]
MWQLFYCIRWGYQNGKQRYRCKECGQLYFWRNEEKRKPLECI